MNKTALPLTSRATILLKISIEGKFFELIVLGARGPILLRPLTLGDGWTVGRHAHEANERLREPLFSRSFEGPGSIPSKEDVRDAVADAVQRESTPDSAS